jgi:predicted dinucleotide-binding enzyme
MPTVSIMGKGNMGQAIGSVMKRGGNDVDQLDRESTDVRGDIVILAVPYPALADIAERIGAQLEGKIVVDICNPLDFGTFDGLLVPPGSSAAEELAVRLPKSHVLKAFNTTFAATLSAGTVGSSKATTTVLIAGDDDHAKKALSQAIAAGGVRAIDAGPLKRAHELEAIGFEQLVLASNERITWTGGFAILD